MKTKSCMLTVFLAFFIGFTCFAQELIEKNFFNSNSKLGSDVIIKKSTIKVDGTKSYKIFEIESPADGNYYLNAWVSGAELEKFGSGKFIEYELTVNNEKNAEYFKPSNNNWHNAAYSDPKTKEKKTVKLIKGLNQIVFSCNAPAIPDIDFISLSQDKEKSEIPDTKYAQFVKQTEQEMIGRIAKPINIPDSLNNLKNGIVLSNPEGNYDHYIGATFKYTYYTLQYFTAGQQVFIATNATNFQHVLEMFSYSDPQSYSWITISNNSLASINVNIPSTGYYYIKIRSWIQSQQGLVNLNVNGQNYYTDCVASGYSGFRCDAPTGTYNYFTCYISGDTRIWLEDNSSFPGRIVAYNDDYYGTGDFYWPLASRINKNFTVPIKGAQFSSYSSYTPTGTCDYYIKCMNSNINSYFPNLKTDDAIQSAPQSNVYNCISWSGGITNYWEWPGNYFSMYWVGSPLASFDNFYNSIRYFGAMTYSRTEATVSNNAVDLWYNPNYYGIGQGDYTHGSVTKSGNNMPHGYSWESKPGGLMRTFHPRYALNNTSPGGYGNVSYYYKPTSLKSVMLLDESIARGLSVIEDVELTKAEKDILTESINALTNNQKDEFENKYIAWKQTWENPEIAIQSNPRMYAKNREYNELIDYCKGQGKSSWPLIFDKIQQVDFFTINALEDLTLAENESVLNKVKKESKLKSTTESGAVIVRSPQTIAMKYIKELLKSSHDFGSKDDNGIIYSNSIHFNVFPNPVEAKSQISFNLSVEAKVSIQVIDLTGRVLSVVVNENVLAAGQQNFDLNIPQNFHGTCLVKLLVNNNVNVQLVVVP